MKTLPIYILIISLVSLLNYNSNAQLNPLGAQYYNNEYITNPALAGKSKGVKLNAAYRKLWSNFPGSPLTQNLTIDYGFDKVGLGMNVNNETAGLFKHTRVVGTYAYHLPIDSGKSSFHFGLSLGFLNQRIEQSSVIGNPNDFVIGDYNSRKNYIDGDFGIAFTSGGLNIQTAIPNLKNFLKKDNIKLVNVVTFYSSISYLIPFTKGELGMAVEPKIAYRGVKGFDNMLDLGAQFSFAEKKFLLLGLYHSNKSATIGMGLDFKRKYLVSGMYTTQTSELNNYTNGSFELNLRVNFLKQK